MGSLSNVNIKDSFHDHYRSRPCHVCTEHLSSMRTVISPSHRLNACERTWKDQLGFCTAFVIASSFHCSSTCVCSIGICFYSTGRIEQVESCVSKSRHSPFHQAVHCKQQVLSACLSCKQSCLHKFEAAEAIPECFCSIKCWLFTRLRVSTLSCLHSSIADKVEHKNCFAMHSRHQAVEQIKAYLLTWKADLCLQTNVNLLDAQMSMWASKVSSMCLQLLLTMMTLHTAHHGSSMHGSIREHSRRPSLHAVLDLLVF